MTGLSDDDCLDPSGDATSRTLLDGAGFKSDRRSSMWFNNRTGRTIDYEKVRELGSEQLTAWLTRRVA
jgi:hypothetical protein